MTDSNALREFSAALFGRRSQTDTATTIEGDIARGNRVPNEGANPTPHPTSTMDLRAFVAELMGRAD